jgi:RNA polymerase sigma-70 factor (ECF subfamily)
MGESVKFAMVLPGLPENGCRDVTPVISCEVEDGQNPPDADGRRRGGGVMMSSDGDVARIQACIDRWRSGDRSALDELVGYTSERLARLTSKMLSSFPGVRRWEQTDDVLQNAMLRLCRALTEVQPPTAADLFRLAAAQVRRELLDMARRYSGPHGLGANHASVALTERDDGGSAKGGPEPVDGTNDPVGLAVWTEFHLAAGALPSEERDAFDLLFYQGMHQADAATLLGVSESTVKRRWQAARLRLFDALGGRMPGL